MNGANEPTPSEPLCEIVANYKQWAPNIHKWKAKMDEATTQVDKMRYKDLCMRAIDIHEIAIKKVLYPNVDYLCELEHKIQHYHSTVSESREACAPTGTRD